MKRIFPIVIFLSFLFSPNIECAISFGWGEGLIALNALFPLCAKKMIDTMISQSCALITHEQLLECARAEVSMVTSKSISFYTGPLTNLALAAPDNRIILGTDYYNVIAGYFDKVALHGYDALSSQEREALDIFKFLIQHEAAHIEKNHIVKKMVMNGVLCLSALAGYAYIKHNTTSRYTHILAYLAVSSSAGLLNNWYQRLQEREADSLVNGSSQINGGIMFFNNLIELFSKQNNPLMYLATEVMVTTHPSNSERRDALIKQLHCQGQYCQG